MLEDLNVDSESNYWLVEVNVSCFNEVQKGSSDNYYIAKAKKLLQIYPKTEGFNEKVLSKCQGTDYSHFI